MINNVKISAKLKILSPWPNCRKAPPSSLFLGLVLGPCLHTAEYCLSRTLLSQFSKNSPPSISHHSQYLHLSPWVSDNLGLSSSEILLNILNTTPPTFLWWLLLVLFHSPTPSFCLFVIKSQHIPAVFRIEPSSILVSFFP